MSEFFWLFASREKTLRESFVGKMKCVNNYEESMRVFLNSTPEFNSYEDFLNFCFEDINEK